MLVEHSFTDGLLTQEEDRCRDGAGQLLDEEGIWPEAGVSRIAQRLDQFFNGFAFAGGKCDLLVEDFEESWVMPNLTGKRIAEIQADPRFAAVAQRLGFSEITNLRDPKRADDFLRWDSIANEMMARTLNCAIGAPLWRYCPDAGLAGWNSAVVSSENTALDANGSRHYSEGDIAGTYQTPFLYGSALGIRNAVAADWDDSLNIVIHETNTIRASARSSSTPILPWVPCRSRVGEDAQHPVVPWANTDYWQEFIYQAMLSGAVNNVLFMNPHPPQVGLFSPDSKDWQAMESVLSDLELQAHGHPLAKPLTTTVLKHDVSSIMSAARTDDGRIVARVTFGAVATSADFVLEGKPVHVTRPAGKPGIWLQIP